MVLNMEVKEQGLKFASSLSGWTMMLVFGAFALSGCQKGSSAGQASVNSNTYTVTLSGAHLSLSKGPTEQVTPDATLSIDVTADAGYTLSNTVTGTCPAGSWSGSTYTTGAITEDCTVTFASIRPLHIYLTSTTYNGTLGGVAGADSKCMSDANYPGSGTYKAFISDGVTRVACTVADCGAGSTSTDWVVQPNTEYRRLDETVIGTSTSVGTFTGTLTHSPGTDTTFATTGILNNWLSAANTYNCGSFTNTTGQTAGAYDPSTTNAAVAFTGLNTQCTDMNRIYCIEQP